MAREVYEWVLSGTLAGQFVQTVQHVTTDRTATPTAYAMARAIALTFISEDDVVDGLLKCLPASYNATSLRVRRVLPSGGPTCIVLGGSFFAHVGYRDAEISSAQVNPTIIWIPTTHPSKTGRLFLPGVAEEDIDAMMIAPALLTEIGNFITMYQSNNEIDDTSEEYHGCVLRKHEVDDHMVPFEGDDIEAGYVSPLIGTQRRRLHPI